VWSNQFQKMVLNRVVTLQNPHFEELAWLHLVEELGHNRDLAKSRSDLQPVFDPILEAVCSWFPSKIGMLSDIEKVVLVHLVVEASALFFYKHVQPAMSASGSQDHFDTHKAGDEAHVQMGYNFLRNASSVDLPRLFEIQRQGWSMLMAVMGRVADLVVHSTGQVDNTAPQPRKETKHVVEPMAARGKTGTPRKDSPYVVEPIDVVSEPRAKSSAPNKASDEWASAFAADEQISAAE
jgi:hypothetical protein